MNKEAISSFKAQIDNLVAEIKSEKDPHIIEQKTIELFAIYNEAMGKIKSMHLDKEKEIIDQGQQDQVHDLTNLL